MDFTRSSTNTVATDELCTSGQESCTSIQDLSDELLDYVFSFLRFVQRIRIELVCKRWQSIASNPMRLILHSKCLKNRKVDDNIVCCILVHCGQALKVLVQKRNPKLTRDSLGKIGEYCPNLVSLEVQLVGNRQVNCIKSIATVCVNLKVFVLKNIVIGPKVHPLESSEDSLQVNYRKTFYSICNKGLFAVAQCCKLLEHLDITDLAYVTLHWLGVINPNLHILSLRRACLSCDSMQCLIRRCTVLEVFTVDRCEPVDHNLLMELLKNLKITLRIFKVTLQGLEDDWRDGLKGLTNLEVLQLYLCDKVDDDLMEVLAEHCGKLRYLDIGDTSVSDVGLISLQKLTCLKELRLGRMIANSALNITGYGLELLVTKGSLRHVTILPRSPELDIVCRKLSVSYPMVRFTKEPVPCSCAFIKEI